MARLKFTTSELNQAAVAELIETGGFDRHLRRLRVMLRDQVDRTAEAVARWFRSQCRVTRPAGGFVL